MKWKSLYHRIEELPQYITNFCPFYPFIFITIWGGYWEPLLCADASTKKKGVYTMLQSKLNEDSYKQYKIKNDISITCWNFLTRSFHLSVNKNVHAQVLFVYYTDMDSDIFEYI